jgi:hypothetical protein
VNVFKDVKIEKGGFLDEKINNVGIDGSLSDGSDDGM